MRCLLVSHFHWDREWYRTFQAYRARLLDAVDAVLERHRPNGFLRGFLEAKGLDWAAALIDQFPTLEQEITQ